MHPMPYLFEFALRLDYIFFFKNKNQFILVDSDLEIGFLLIDILTKRFLYYFSERKKNYQNFFFLIK